MAYSQVRSALAPWLWLFVLLLAAASPLAQDTSEEAAGDAATEQLETENAASEPLAADESANDEALQEPEESPAGDAAEPPAPPPPVPPPPPPVPPPSPPPAAAPSMPQAPPAAAPSYSLPKAPVVASPAPARPAPAPVVSSGGNIHTKIANAKAAGLADSEIAAHAAKAQRHASEDLKKVASAPFHSRSSLKSAFDNAAKAGVAQYEHDAARKSVVDDFTQRIAKAKASMSGFGVSADTVEEMAGLLSHGKNWGVDSSELKSARAAFEQLATETHKKQDMILAKAIVRASSEAGAQIPAVLKEWVTTLEQIRGVKDRPASESALQGMLDLVAKAKSIGLPANAEFAEVERKVQAWAATKLQESSASAGNMTEGAFDRLLADFERAKLAGNNNTGVSYQLLSFARSQLERVCGGSPHSYNGQALKKALVNAERAGVPESERTAAHDKVVAGIESLLRSHGAPSASSSSSSSNFSSSFSSSFGSSNRRADRASLKSLTHAIYLGHRYPTSQTLLKDAKAYLVKQGNIAISENDLAFAETIMDAASEAPIDGAILPEQMRSWVKMVRQLRPIASKIEDSKRDKMPQFIEMVTQAKSMRLPNCSEYQAVEQKVHAWITLDIQEISRGVPTGNGTYGSAGPMDLAHAVGLVQKAKLVGLPRYSFSSLESTVQGLATSELTRASDTRPYDHGKIKSAFMKAELAGVPQATLDNARESLKKGIETQLLAACSNGTRSKEFVDHLSKSLSLAGAWGVDNAVREKARKFYLDQADLALQTHDHEYGIHLQDASSQAGVDLPSTLKERARVLKRLREADKLPTQTDRLPNLLDILAQAKNVGIDAFKSPELASIAAKAKSLAQADLQVEL